MKLDFVWRHHYHGWNYVLNHLKILSNPNGIRFIGDLDNHLFRTKFEEPFVGIMHAVPTHPKFGKYLRNISLEQNLNGKNWQYNKKLCKGLFSLSQYTFEYLKKFNVPCDYLYHPVGEVDKKFDINKFILNKDKKLFLYGHWLRDYSSFDKIQTTFKKITTEFKNPGNDCFYDYSFKNTEVLPWMNNDEVDKILEENIVCLCLYDVSACNGILDCITRNTPIVLNRLPAAEEYLGKDYPLFYSCLEEIDSILNLDKIIEANNYLINLDKEKFTVSHFIQKMTNSELYKNIKLNLF